jgi:hypothetical protein
MCRRTSPEKEEELASWLEEQRALFVEGALPQEKMAQLDAKLPGWFSLEAMPWFEAERYRILAALGQISDDAKKRVDSKIPDFGWTSLEDYCAALLKYTASEKKMPGLSVRGKGGEAIGLFLCEAGEASTRG